MMSLDKELLRKRIQNLGHCHETGIPLALFDDFEIVRRSGDAYPIGVYRDFEMNTHQRYHYHNTHREGVEMNLLEEINKRISA